MSIYELYFIFYKSIPLFNYTGIIFSNTSPESLQMVFRLVLACVQKIFLNKDK